MLLAQRLKVPFYAIRKGIPEFERLKAAQIRGELKVQFSPATATRRSKTTRDCGETVGKIPYPLRVPTIGQSGIAELRSDSRIAESRSHPQSHNSSSDGPASHLEISRGKISPGERIVIVDDAIATGNTDSVVVFETSKIPLT